MKDTCNTCGMWKGLHHYQTMQCPVNMSEDGTFRDTVYKNDDELDALRAENAKLRKALKLIFEVVKAEVK